MNPKNLPFLGSEVFFLYWGTFSVKIKQNLSVQTLGSFFGSNHEENPDGRGLYLEHPMSYSVF